MPPLASPPALPTRPVLASPAWWRPQGTAARPLLQGSRWEVRCFHAQGGALQAAQGHHHRRRCPSLRYRPKKIWLRLEAAERQSRLVQNGAQANACMGWRPNCAAFATEWSASKCVYGVASPIALRLLRYGAQANACMRWRPNCTAFATVWSKRQCVCGVAPQSLCMCCNRYKVQRKGHSA